MYILSFATPPNQSSFAILRRKATLIMIDISQLTSLISSFRRVETEKSAVKREQYQTCLNIAEREQIIQ